MRTTSLQTPEALGDAFLSQLRAEHAAAVARAERVAIEAERLTKEAEKLAGALEAAERFVSEVFASATPQTATAVVDVPTAQESATAHAPEIARPSSGFVVVPRGQSVTLARDESWAKRLRGMTQKQALVAIAEHEGGVLDVKKARDIFIEAKVTDSKNPRTVYGVIHTILRGSPKFEKADIGTFRLIPPQSPSPGMIGQPLLNEWRNGTE